MGSRGLRVLALTHVFPRSPDDHVAPFLLAWARGLRDTGAQVVVVAPHAPGLPLRHDVGGITVRRVRYAPDAWERLAYRGRMHELVRSPEGPALLSSLGAALVRGVRAQAAAGRPDVLHVHWCLPGAVVARAAGADVPVVVSVHGTDVALLEARPALARTAAWALRSADRVEAVSRHLGERLTAATGRAPDAVGPMPLPHLAPPSLPLPARGDDVFRIAAVGRLVEGKGFADLIAAVARLPFPAALTVVGEGPERDRLAALAARLGVDLTLPGALAPARLRAALGDADVVAQPSHREGLGLVAAEAVVAGVPVVATDSGGVRDVLGPDDLVAVGDIAGLAAALRRVAADPVGARARTGRRAQVLRTLLSPRAVAARTLAGYRTLGIG